MKTCQRADAETSHQLPSHAANFIFNTFPWLRSICIYLFGLLRWLRRHARINPASRTRCSAENTHATCALAPMNNLKKKKNTLSGLFIGCDWKLIAHSSLERRNQISICNMFMHKIFSSRLPKHA
jgi:hypothetical protein